MENRIWNEINSIKNEMINLGESIFENPELCFKEF